MEAKLLEALAALGNLIASAIPRIAVGILLIIVGWALAKGIEVALRTMLIRLRFDSLMKRAGVTKALRRTGLRQEVSLLVPKLAYFLIVFLVAKVACDVIGLIAVSNAIGALFSYLPNVLAALVLLILGTTAGQFTGQMVTRAAESSGFDSAPALGKLVSALIIFLVAMMAIGQLKIDTEMVRIVTSFVLGAAALGFGLAFGLGTREVIRNIVTGFYTRKLLAVGNNLTIAGQSGTLTAITPTHAVLNSGVHQILVANATFLEQTSIQNVNLSEVR
jgi:Conserved TM helix/Mechanosensitive ion channel